jgi:hypothetical protein
MISALPLTLMVRGCVDPSWTEALQADSITAAISMIVGMTIFVRIVTSM